MKSSGRSKKILFQTLVIIGIVIFVNLLASNFYSYIDLTEDRRFTLEDSTKKLLEEVDDIMTIDVLLQGNMTSGLTQLRERTFEILKEFKSLNPSIEYKTIDLNKGTVEEINTIRKNLQQDGITPFNLRIVENDQQIEKLIYPYAILKKGTLKVPISLLESKGRGETEEQSISNSMAQLEYKLINAIEKVSRSLSLIHISEPTRPY